MTRRLAVLAVALAGAVVLPSCSTFDRNTAATVDGVDISDAVVQFDLIRNQPDPAPGSATSAPPTAITGAGARQTLTLLIQTTIGARVLLGFGADLASTRATERTRLESALSQRAMKEWQALSLDEQNLELDANGALSTALGNVHASPPTDLEKLYTDPEQTGFLCLRAMAFDTEQKANDAAAQLDAGTPFADLANQQQPASNGGIVSSGGDECVSVGQFSQAPLNILTAIYGTAPGKRSPVVATPAGANGPPAWYIFLNRPYDEIQKQLADATALAPQISAVYGAYFRANVTVASRYGRWDPVLSVVVPLT